MFEACRSVPRLREDEVHVWHVPAEPAAAPRAITAVARAALDRLLQGYSGFPHAPAIERGTHGKPFAPELGGLEFNLSHAGADVLLAFAHGQSIGIDLERRERRMKLEGVTRRFFTPAEADALECIPMERRLQAFLDVWTHKEAVLKALGSGLQFGLARVEFSLDGAGEVEAMTAIASEAGRVQDWRLCRLRPRPDLLGALAWCGPARNVRTFMLET